MTPVQQQFLHDDAAGVVGDCFRACVASILDLPIEAVPHFALLGHRWSLVAEVYLAALKRDFDWVPPAAYAGGLVVASGQSPRCPDIRHAVIWRDGQMIHDPHPDGTGIVGEPDGFYEIGAVGSASVFDLMEATP